MSHRDENEIAHSLSDASLGRRNSVLEDLRVALQVKSKRQPFADPCLIFKGLAATLKDDVWDTRYQCVKLIGELIPLLKSSDVEPCMNFVLVPLIGCLGDAKYTVGLATGQTLSAYVERTVNFKRLVYLVIRHGIEVENLTTRKGVLVNLSFLCSQKHKDHNFKSLVTSLVIQLSDSSLSDTRPSVMHFLEQLSTLIGRKQFDAHVDELPTSYREHYFRLLNDASSLRTGSADARHVTNAETSAGHRLQQSSSSAGAVELFAYGIVPGRIIDHLSRHNDTRTRALAAEELRLTVEDPDSFRGLEPHASNFLQCLTSLLGDSDDFQVVTTLLDVMGTTVSRLDAAGVRGCLSTVVSGMTRCMPDSNRVVRGAVMRLAMRVMQTSSPSAMVELLADNLSNKNPKVRQSSLDVITAALLSHPSYSFDLTSLCRAVSRSVVDTKKVVRQAGLECLAVISQSMGAGKQQSLISAVDALEMNSDGIGAMAAVQARLARHKLPTIGSDGLVQYAVLGSSSATGGSRREAGVVGADVEWIDLGASGTGFGGVFTARSRVDEKAADGHVSHEELPLKSPRRHLSAGKNLAKLPWENSADEFNGSVNTSRQFQSHSARSDASKTNGSQTSLTDRSANAVPVSPPPAVAWDTAPIIRAKKPPKQLPEISSSFDVSSARSDQLKTPSDLEDISEAKEDMDSSLRQIRSSATKKQLSKIFDRSGSLDSLTSLDSQNQLIIGKRIASPFDTKAPLPGLARDDSSGGKGGWYTGSDSESSSSNQFEVKRTIKVKRKTGLKTDHNRVYSEGSDSDLQQQQAPQPMTVVGSGTRRPPAGPRQVNGVGGHRRINSSDSIKSNGDRPDGVSKQFGQEQHQSKSSGDELMRMTSATDSNNPEHWKPFRDPHKSLDEALRLLGQDDWERKIEGLAAVRRLATYHESVLCSQLHSVTMAVVSEIRNLRSQVSQQAVICLRDMYRYLRKSMETDLDKTVPVLLGKTAETNKFIRNVSEEALFAMIDSVSANRALVVLTTHGASHRNVAVRNVSAQLLSMLVDSMGPEWALKEFPERILPVSTQFVMDGSPEARYSGQKILYSLMSASPDDFDRALNKHVTPNTIRNIQDKLDALKKKGLGDPPPNMSRVHRASTDGRKVNPDSSTGSDAVHSNNQQTSSAGSMKRRPGRGPTSATRLDDVTIDELQSIESSLASNDWRERLGGIEQLSSFARQKPGALSAQITKVFGKFIPCLRDPNSKVNLAALIAMERMIPILRDSMSNVISHWLQTVVSNLASANGEIHGAAERVLDAALEHLEPSQLLQPLIVEAQKSKPQVKADLTERISYLVETIHKSRSSYATSHALPFLWHLLAAVAANAGSTTRLREATTSYVLSLHSLLGDELLFAAAQTSSVTRSMHDLLNDILDST